MNLCLEDGCRLINVMSLPLYIQSVSQPKPSIQNPTSEEEPRSEDSNSEEEELQSRRGFFKRVAKTVLPVIGGLQHDPLVESCCKGTQL